MWECICAAPNQPAFEVRHRIASLTGRSRVVCSKAVGGLDPSLEHNLASAIGDCELAREVRIAVVSPDDHSFCFKRAVIGGNVLLIAGRMWKRELHLDCHIASSCLPRIAFVRTAILRFPFAVNFPYDLPETAVSLLRNARDANIGKG